MMTTRPLRHKQSNRILPDFCRNGHEYTPENTHWRKASKPRKDGTYLTARVCKSCVAAAVARHQTKPGYVRPRRTRNPDMPQLEVGSAIPDNEIHVTHTGIYFGRKKPPFNYAYIWFDIDPVEITFEPVNHPVRGLAWPPKPKVSDKTVNPCHVVQAYPMLWSGKIPFGVYERYKDLTYHLTDRPLPKQCRNN